MHRLSIAEAAVLARVAQYDQLPMEDRERMLYRNDVTAHGREIGLILLGKGEPSTDDIAKVANRIRTWADRNRARQRLRRYAPPLVAV